MRTCVVLGIALCSLVVACGDNSSGPDADSDAGVDADPGPDGGPSCLPFVAELAGPGTFSGTTEGGSNDLIAQPSETCPVFGTPDGEDVLVRVTGLTIGVRYFIELDTDVDLGIYVLESCPETGGPVICLAGADNGYTDELLAFTATATEHTIVVDSSSFDGQPATAGAFTLLVQPAECDELVDGIFAGCTGSLPYCRGYRCVECVWGFDCGASAPSCSEAGACAAGPMSCTGDDADDMTAAGDDGPSVARPLVTPTVGTSTSVSKAICSAPRQEEDWYRVTVPTGGISIELTYAASTERNLSMVLYTPTGLRANSGLGEPGGAKAINGAGLTPGEYLLLVYQFSPMNSSVAVPYTLTARLPECETSFQCDASAPVCNPVGLCVTGPTECTGDDAADTGTGDDGPNVATVLAAPTAGNPTIVSGAACSSPALEADWFEVMLPTGSFAIEVEVDNAGGSFSTLVDLLDASGTRVKQDAVPDGARGGFRADVVAGTYYVVIDRGHPLTTAAVGYTLTLRVPECDTSFDCQAAAPVCSVFGTCVAGPDRCTGDDAAEAGGDDGPAGARVLAAGVGTSASLTGAVCARLSDGEVDYFRVDVTAGQGMVVNLTWPGATPLDLSITDSQDRRVGASLWSAPEEITLTYLPAGSYYVRVTNPGTSNAAAAYTVSAELTAAQTCASAADCAAEFATQNYRGQCTNAGTCEFITATARTLGQPCDRNSVCASNRCSYLQYEADAAESVCTTTCASNVDCAAVGSGLACTNGLGASNICVPTCSSDLDCGTFSSGRTADTNQRWDYLTCTVSTGVCSL